MTHGILVTQLNPIGKHTNNTRTTTTLVQGGGAGVHFVRMHPVWVRGHRDTMERRRGPQAQPRPRYVF
jgi:hypothetical protein